MEDKMRGRNECRSHPRRWRSLSPETPPRRHVDARFNGFLLDDPEQSQVTVFTYGNVCSPFCRLFVSHHAAIRAQAQTSRPLTHILACLLLLTHS